MMNNKPIPNTSNADHLKSQDTAARSYEENNAPLRALMEKLGRTLKTMPARGWGSYTAFYVTETGKFAGYPPGYITVVEGSSYGTGKPCGQHNVMCADGGWAIWNDDHIVGGVMQRVLNRAAEEQDKAIAQGHALALRELNWRTTSN